MEHTESQIRLSWSRIEELTAELAAHVEASGFKPDFLIGIAVGGLVPLALLARELEVRNAATITARSYDKANTQAGEVTISCTPEIDLRGKRVLLIDEIADTGQTLRVISEMLKSRYEVEDIKIATLVVNTIHCTFPPDFSVLPVTQWVAFPWEEKNI